MAVGLVVPAAGRGSRFGSPENKVWARLAGRTVLDRVLAVFQAHARVDAIVLVGAAEELERLRAAAVPYAKVRAVVKGGATRPESVGCGLAALPDDCEVVLVHDAARPCVSHALITRVIEAVERWGAAVPGFPVTDTVKRAGPDGRVQETVPRDGLWTVQTPQGARLAHLRAAYGALGPRVTTMTDEASVLEAAGYPVRMVKGEESNIKVTRPADLARAEQVLRIESPESRVEREDTRASRLAPRAFAPSVCIRTGFGYDVHAFAEGRPLWLGGVLIPHARGLAGHSDADAMLHAVCDALLGAAAMGDIGVLFPDTDAAHRDRPSIEFVQEVCRRLDGAGWRIVNVDIMLLAEEPRIGPYRPDMTAVLADGLQIAPTQINIKATTSERMGFVGRREGIACWAVATLQKSAADPEP